MFSFSSEEGTVLVRQVLQDLWPHTPRDYQLEAVTKALDGTDILVILPTGAGKTAILTMFMVILNHMKENPGEYLEHSTRFPADPIMVVVYPTNCLEEEQAVAFREAGLTTVVINAETPERSDMWTRAGESGSRVLLLSPEQLISKQLEKLVNNSGFRKRVCLLAVDEVHLLDTWGKSFRKAYLQIQYMRARFESSLVMTAMTATLLPREQTQQICKFIGLRDHHHTVQRSNRRPEIQLLFRVLSHGIENWEFPDLRWIIDDMRQKKIIVFCTSIRDGFRVFSYLWKQLDSPVTVRGEQIRMYNALNWPDYNLKTRELMRKSDGCRVIVATDILMVGVDFPDIDDVVIIGHPPNVNDYLQKIGRAGRDHTLVPNPRGITYITSHAKRAAYEKLGVDPPTARPKRKVKPKPSNRPRVRHIKKHKKLDMETPSMAKSSMSVEMAKLIISGCKTNELDAMYENPVLHPSTQCNCSGCVPEQEVSKKSPQRRAKRETRFNLTKEMKEIVTKRLIRLREEIYITADSKMLADPFLVLPRLVPNGLISRIVDALPQLTQESLDNLIGENEIVKAHASKIWLIVLELQASFRQQLGQKADEKEQRKTKKRCTYTLCRACG
ncbi:P-loop containing nucleoside triphosphate hydrolase protein [Thelephora ganbajun]|uniref:P-loop containing nucleoside triphosphate hydrolase protein n=1 Tax=Thelephora ganbajun TaxID=370292 RepID=A0ACB6Z6K7_THEGA|nr:P-loop containing nucleoside triphosphate hydrolase protein [Thelephora ganbajun]